MMRLLCQGLNKHSHIKIFIWVAPSRDPRSPGERRLSPRIVPVNLFGGDSPILLSTRYVPRVSTPALIHAMRASATY